MSTPPPRWHPDPNLSPELQPAEAVAERALAAPQFGGYDAPTSVDGLHQVASASDPRFDVTGPRTLTQRNSTTFTAMAVVALYLVLAASTGIVLIGIFPAVLAFRALQRREPLAVLAIASAAVAIVFSLTVLTRH
jgi:hypothetical protein